MRPIAIRKIYQWILSSTIDPLELKDLSIYSVLVKLYSLRYTEMGSGIIAHKFSSLILASFPSTVPSLMEHGNECYSSEM